MQQRTATTAIAKVAVIDLMQQPARTTSTASTLNSLLKTYPKSYCSIIYPKRDLITQRHRVYNIDNKFAYNLLKSPPGNSHGSCNKATSSNKSANNTAKEAKAIFKNDDGDENSGDESRMRQLLMGLLQGYRTDEEITIKSNQEKKKTAVDNDPFNNVNITVFGVSAIPPGNGHRSRNKSTSSNKSVSIFHYCNPDSSCHKEELPPYRRRESVRVNQ